MYAALFEMESWMGKQQDIVTGKDPAVLMDRLCQIQDLSCLIYMGRMQEDAQGQKQLDRLEVLLQRHSSGKLTARDLRGLDVTLSIGKLRCVLLLEGEDALPELRRRYPGATVWKR